MTYKTTIRNGHHYVDMEPKQRTIEEAIGKGVADFLDGFHKEMERLAKSMQEGLDRLPKHPEPTETIEEVQG